MNKIIWKDNAPYAVCLSHDVDRVTKQWYHYLVYCKKGIGCQLKSLREKFKGDEPYYNFYKIAELEKSYGVKSTFFFLNEGYHEISANFLGRYKINDARVIKVIRELDADGFEIGLHGSYYSYNHYALLKKEKDVLESIVGHSIVSARQHFLNKDDSTWKIHAQIGIKYDSTVGNKKTTGEGLSIFPYYTNEGILEMPITVMDTVPMNTEEERVQIMDACRSVADRGGLLMLNFHQRQLRSTEYYYEVDTYKRLIEMGLQDGAMLGRMCDIGEYIEDICRG